MDPPTFLMQDEPGYGNGNGSVNNSSGGGATKLDPSALLSSSSPRSNSSGCRRRRSSSRKGQKGNHSPAGTSTCSRTTVRHAPSECGEVQSTSSEGSRRRYDEQEDQEEVECPEWGSDYDSAEEAKAFKNAEALGMWVNLSDERAVSCADARLASHFHIRLRPLTRFASARREEATARAPTFLPLRQLGAPTITSW